MTVILLMALTILLTCASLRGEGFHNHLVELTAKAFRAVRFWVTTECPLFLPGGALNSVDIYAERPDVRIICEVETSARYVVTNAAKARQAGHPLWIIVPNRRVLSAVRNKLTRAGYAIDGREIRILLQAEVGEELARSFSQFSAVNAGVENKEEKTQEGKP